MKFTITTFIIFQFCHLAIAQQNREETQDSSTDETIPNGIYTSLSALRKSQTLLNYKISYRFEPDTSDQWVTLSQIRIKPKIKNGEKLIWGFSDGSNYYINSRLYDPPGSLRYSKLLYRGKIYSIFLAVIRLALPYQKTLAILNMENGRMLPLNKSIVSDLIENNEILTQKLENGPKKKKDLIEILIEYDKVLTN